MKMGIAEREIARIRWDELREATGPATHIGEALRGLLSSTSAEDATSHYWRLENHVVVQGSIFEVAEPTAAVLVAALADERPPHVQVSILELLFQILSGKPAASEVDAGGGNLDERCRQRARDGYWLLVREAFAGQRDAALDILRILDPGRAEVVAEWSAR